MRSFDPTLALTLAFVAVGTAQPPAEPDGQVRGASVVKLLEPGTAPRQSLRLAPLLGSHHVVDLLMRVTNERVMDGTKMPVNQAPAMKMSFEMVVTDQMLTEWCVARGQIWPDAEEWLPNWLLDPVIAFVEDPDGYKIELIERS